MRMCEYMRVILMLLRICSNNVTNMFVPVVLTCVGASMIQFWISSTLQMLR